MSIHDIDKNSAGRESPMPNSHDEQGLARMANGTVSVDPRTGASITPGFIQTKNSQILTNDGSTNRLLITPTQIKISQSGNDVTTATNDKLIFNSSQDIFKIVGSGTATIPTSGTTTATVSVPHGLGFIPAFIAYVFVLSNYNTLPLVNVNTTTGVVISAYSGWSDATNINFQVIVPGGTVGGTTPVKYFLFQETAN